VNERIRELADEAKQYCFEQSQKRLAPEDYMPYSDMYDKKFAELIVRECADVIQKRIGPKSALDVLEHFGVE
jgi:hypothetical protein